MNIREPCGRARDTGQANERERERESSLGIGLISIQRASPLPTPTNQSSPSPTNHQNINIKMTPVNHREASRSGPLFVYMERLGCCYWLAARSRGFFIFILFVIFVFFTTTVHFDKLFMSCYVLVIASVCDKSVSGTV
jgi:hypothetical protein